MLRRSEHKHTGKTLEVNLHELLNRKQLDNNKNKDLFPLNSKLCSLLLARSRADKRKAAEHEKRVRPGSNLTIPRIKIPRGP
jgi:hypothetical protein